MARLSVIVPVALILIFLLLYLAFGSLKEAVLTTSITTVLGPMPLLLSRGIGSEVQRPLASVVVFGLTSATALTLFVIPAFYPWFSTKVDNEK